MPERTFRYADDVRRRGPAPPAAPFRCLRAPVAVTLLIVQLAGCYTYVPAAGRAVPAGAQVSAGVTDRGRVGLAEIVGPGALRINGRVLSSSDTALVLDVTRVQFIDVGVPVSWEGEPVALNRDFLSDVRERTFSRSRTWITVGVAALGLVLASTLALTGFGSDDPPTDRVPGGNGENQ